MQGAGPGARREGHTRSGRAEGAGSAGDLGPGHVQGPTRLPSPALTALSHPVNPSAKLARVADWPRNEPSPLLKASQTPSSFGAEVT